MNVYEVRAPDLEAARRIATRLYGSIRQSHDWGKRFEADPRADVLDLMSQLAPRDMRRAWMTAFGNAKLDARDHIETRDLPQAGSRRQSIGFMH
jgi:ATP-dependent Lon protease